MVGTNPYIVAIIPARGGSKSIPRKNVKKLGEHPLIAYSIAAGLQANLVSRVIVSTDDEDIARIARDYGADVPFVRPSELAEDHVVDLPVFEHAIHWFSKNDRLPDIVVQLRPTSPFRPMDCVDGAIEQLIKNEHADSVRGVTPSGQNPFKMWKIEHGVIKPLIKSEFTEPYNMPRQQLPATFWQTGHIEVIRTTTITEKHSLTGDTILPYIIEPDYAIDLDTMQQWQFAEYMLKHSSLPIIKPASMPYSALSDIRLLVLDFDGVMTDNRVYVDQNGTESVACSRSDGTGVARLQKAGIHVVVLSTETNPVVSARCEKLNIACLQGINEKHAALIKLAAEYNVELNNIAFVGNDINDLEALKIAGMAIAVADAHPDIINHVDVILQHKGGDGAVREICEQLINQFRGEIS
ncbi:acylneuraminate cytidylyltransferase [candidate division KSB1 bacterium]|nr:acylneuraminate cytidylyltransferase [candidate division KSB1 bacterium]